MSIHRLTDSLFEIRGPIFHRWSMKDIFKLLSVLGYDSHELELAFIELILRDFDEAHFGINRTFMYALNRD